MLETRPGGVIALGGGAIESERTRDAPARAGDDRLARRSRRRGVAACAGHGAAAREGRGRVSRPLRASPAALRSGSGLRRAGRRRSRPRRRRHPCRARCARAARRARAWRRADRARQRHPRRRDLRDGRRSSRSAPASPRATSCRRARRRRRWLPSSGCGSRSGWNAAARSLALGGGCTTDAAGFAAAGYMRGIDWMAVPTTLVGQVDAAIGGKTAIDLPGARTSSAHSTGPLRTIIDPGTLETLPDERARERPGRAREDGSARRGAVLGAAATRGRSPLRRLQDRRLPARPARPRRARAAQPRAHVCARARGGGRLRAAAREGRRARTARRAQALRARYASGRGDAARRSPCASTETAPGLRSPATRSPSAARRGSSCSTHPGGRASDVELPRAEVRAALDALIDG